jgi:hypothetical protein
MRRSRIESRILLGIAAALLMTACTTMTEMQTASPRATYRSPKSSAALEECIAGRLSWLVMPSVVRGPNRTTIAFGSSGSTVLTVTLSSVDKETLVEVRQKLTYGVRVKNNVEGCL